MTRMCCICRESNLCRPFSLQRLAYNEGSLQMSPAMQRVVESSLPRLNVSADESSMIQQHLAPTFPHTKGCGKYPHSRIGMADKKQMLSMNKWTRSSTQDILRTEQRALATSSQFLPNDWLWSSTSTTQGINDKKGNERKKRPRHQTGPAPRSGQSIFLFSLFVP